VKDTGIRPPVDRFSIDDGELANLKGFGQTRPSFYVRRWTRGTRPMPPVERIRQAPASTEGTAYHRPFAREQPNCESVSRGFCLVSYRILPESPPIPAACRAIGSVGAKWRR
jgi:hypothetical protein